jgi:hypothetical protein
MRYALADALVRREFAAGSVPSLKDAAALHHPEYDEAEHAPRQGKKLRPTELKEMEDHRAQHMAATFLGKFGECVVRADTARSYSLLMSKATSSEEKAAFNSLMSNFSSCFPAGQKLAFGRSTLRGTIALNFYRMAHGPRVVAAPAGAAR